MPANRQVTLAARPASEPRLVEKRHVERKAAAPESCASQQHRRYAEPECVWKLVRTHGST